MAFDHKHRGVHVSGGPGIVAHLSNLIAFADGEEQRVNELIAQLNALADAPWQEVVRTLTARITDAGYDAHPNISCVSIEDDRVAAFVFGNTYLSIELDGQETVLNGRDSSTWIDVALRGSVERVLGGAQSQSAIVGVLRDGVIPAGGFMLDTVGPIPASGRWADEVARQAEAQPAPEAATQHGSQPEDQANLSGMFARIDERMDDVDGETVNDVVDVADTGAPAPEPITTEATTTVEPISPQPVALRSVPTGPEASPAIPDLPSDDIASPPPIATLTSTRPQLRGVRCPDGHLSNPLKPDCGTCGLRIDPSAPHETGDRPVLGTITFDDGAVLGVDRPAAIGSDVPSGYEIDGEPATIVRLDDGIGGISSVQVEVRLSGWNIEISDMHSEHGTYTTLAGERQTRTKLRSGQSVTMQPGMTVETGGRNFTFTQGLTPPAPPL